MDLIESLNWRYATKRYSEKKVSADKLRQITEAINLSASSAGMQPYRLFVLENDEIRRQLGEDSFNAQIVTASHLLVFAAYSAITQKDIENYMQLIAGVRGTPVEDLAPFKTNLERGFLGRTDEENFIWSARQAYIALGTGIIAAANLQVDATPMEGFNPQKLDDLLGLKEKGLKSVILALGYRDAENDVFASMKKVRVPKEEFVTEV